MTNKLVNMITSPSLTRRLFALWGLGIAINLLAWSIGFFFLPEGAIRGVLPAPELIPDNGGWGAIFGRIFVYNIVIGCGLIVGANLFRVGRLPLGYVPVLFHWGMFGLLLGTNSFGVARERAATPDLLALVRSPGFAELTAFTFVAAATIGLHMYRQESLWRLRTTRTRRWADVRLSLCELATVAVAVLLVLAGAAAEAGNILG